MKDLTHKLKKNSIYFKAKFKNITQYFMKEPKPEKWVFIVGCYNSGTTLLHKILAAHPKIGSLPLEGRQFTNELPLAETHGLPRLWALKPELFYLDENQGDQIDVGKIKRQWAYMFNDPERPVLIEKSIINAARTRWLQKHFENSHFIILMRNGYAVAEGIKRKAGHDIEKAITQWKVSYEILLNDMEFLKNKMYLTYEDMTAHPKQTINSICDFLKIEHLPRLMFDQEFKVHERVTKINNLNQKSLESLTKEDVKIINNIAEDLIVKLGYDLINK